MIRITNPTGRKTECRTVTINGVTLCFSYETLVGFIDRDGTRHRVTNQWGTTTARHIKECGLDFDQKDCVEWGGSDRLHWFDNDALEQAALKAICEAPQG